MTPTSIGGLLLIVGAFFTFRGEMSKAIWIYTIADFCWILAAIATGDVFAIITVSIGGILGIAALYRMQIGKMRKTLKW